MRRKEEENIFEICFILDFFFVEREQEEIKNNERVG